MGETKMLEESDKRFGYPVCCITDWIVGMRFHNRIAYLQRTAKINGRQARSRFLLKKFVGLMGYTPCPRHAKSLMDLRKTKCEQDLPQAVKDWVRENFTGREWSEDGKFKSK